MKKTLLLLLFILISATISGQDPEVEWGIKGGVNLSNLTHADATYGGSWYSRKIESKMKLSLHLGLFVEFGLYRDLLFLQPELLYSRQGNRYSIDGYKIWNRLNYINVPIMFKVRFIKGLSVDFGPQVGFLVNAKTKLEGKGEKEKSSFTDDCERSDFGIAMGISIYSKDRYEFSLRYIRGLTAVNKDLDEDSRDSENSVFQLSAGIRF